MTAASKESLKLLDEALPKDVQSALNICEEFELEVSPGPVYCFSSVLIQPASTAWRVGGSWNYVAILQGSADGLFI